MSSVLLILTILTIIEVQHLIESKEIATRIMGGNVAQLGIFPHQVSIQYIGSHICGGAIITAEFILTVAHCCFRQDGEQIPPAHLKVIVGEIFWRSNRSESEKQVIKVVYHERFNIRTSENDIAVMKLDTDLLPWTQHIYYITVAEQPPGEMICYVTGWGYSQPGDALSDVLKFLNVSTESASVCKKFYGYRLKAGMICAKPPGDRDGVCVGDSGGPLVCGGLLFGLVSWKTHDCGMLSIPAVYTDVAYYRKWIYDVAIKDGQMCLKNEIGSTTIILLSIIVYLLE